MSRAERIREWLKEQGATHEDATVTTGQVQAALGLSRHDANSTLHDMKRSGYVQIVGSYGEFGFYLTGKTPRVTAQTKRERMDRENELRRKRRQANGMLPWDEYITKRRASSKPKAIDQDRANRREALDRARQIVREMKAAAKATIAAKRTAKRVAKVRAAVEVGCRFTSIAPVKTVEAWPSSEDFIKAGGVVQVLTNGEVSKPFRAIGFNNRRAA